MRMLPKVVAGAAMISLALAPSTAFACTSTETDGTSTETAGSTPSPSTDLPLGTLHFTPSSGAPGSVITVKPETPCVDGSGAVGKEAGVYLLDKIHLNDLSDDTPVAAGGPVKTSKSGGWSATLTIPKKAKAGDTYAVVAVCTINSVETDEEPFLVYDVPSFLVAAAPTAPVAKPVTKNPAFTG